VDDRHGNEVNMDYDLSKLIDAIITDATSGMFADPEHGLEYWIDGASPDINDRQHFQPGFSLMFYKQDDRYCTFKEGPNEPMMRMVNDESSIVMWDAIFDPTKDEVAITDEEDLSKIREALQMHLDVIRL